jgi:uncharacterized protein (DUF3820 family)
MSNSIGGMDFVRPPMLKIKKVKDTTDYKEYEVTTFRTPQDRLSVDTKDDNYLFTSVTDSLIFCNETMTIQMPKKKFMKKKGKHKFAYAFGMFPFPKTGKAAYLDGCILGALGLKRQRVNADIICFVTPDISFADRQKLALVFDDVIRVPYISPYDMPDDGDEALKTIKMDPAIFKNCNNYSKMHPYTHVFFKLHIFNPDIFPYEKVCFVDSDLVPMNYFDSLFMLDTPAGWVEYRKKFPYKEGYAWDRCDFLQHGQPIPKIFTDIDTPGGGDVNAGLLVISPSKKEYNSMISEITSPLQSWMGPEKYHKGFYDFNFDDPVGRKFVPNSYCYPEQNYLTKRYSGKWTFIEFAFQSWTLDPCNSFGIHMAAFNPKPWFKQPAGTSIQFTEKPEPYVKLFDTDDKDILMPVDIPKAVAMFDESKNYENISISYELFNDLIIWGLVKYPDLHTFFMGETEIHGSKKSFDKDIFKPLNDKHQFLHFKDIKKGDTVYKRLSMSQKYICNLLNDYEKFAPKIKDKFTSICKTKLFDRYGNYVVNLAMINYPDVKDIYKTEETLLLKEKRMPFGKFKGKLIDEMDEKYMKSFVQMKGFMQNPKIRNVFRKTKFRGLLKSERDYKVIDLPTTSKATTSKATTRKRKTKRMNTYGGASIRIRKNTMQKAIKSRKSKQSLYYFYMDHCLHCDIFNKTWRKLVKEFKSKLTMKKINGPLHTKLMQEFNVSNFPTIILTNGNKNKLYRGDRSFKHLIDWIQAPD